MEDVSCVYRTFVIFSIIVPLLQKYRKNADAAPLGWSGSKTNKVTLFQYVLNILTINMPG